VKVPKPSSDSTSPTLRWHVENRTTSAVSDHIGQGTVAGKKGEEFRVTLIAKDPEGIQKITMGGGYQKGCSSSGDGISSIGHGLYAGKEQTLAPDGDGNVLTQIFLIESYVPDVTCSGGTWQQTTIGLVGSGTNYFNGTTNGSLTISIMP
jgi:hypothetical protein